ncbi:MAG: type I restriction enzyme HsdR N-terminal domain-containing protein [Myxococcales bacterium]|nr:type I restriction enzyme HsdR N-terminal domain-containing protein [Myxococcales bacterium]
MGFVDELRALSEQVKRRLANVKSEEATKQALILPFFQVLGYDIYDPSEVQPEYVADFAKKKSNGTFEKVDYAVLRAGVPVMLVECKVAGSEPQDADGQLARYFNATTTVKVGVVTNGTRYRRFGSL